MEHIFILLCFFSLGQKFIVAKSLLGKGMNSCKPEIVTTDPYEQKIILDIENSLNKVTGRLQGRTRQEQELVIHQKHENLIATVLGMAAGGAAAVGAAAGGAAAGGAAAGAAGIASTAVVPYSGAGFLTWGYAKLISFFGYDPFQWLSFEKSDYNAQLANKASSDPQLFNALMKGGEIFESKNSFYLNKKTQQLYREVTSIKQVNELANLLIDFCKVLPVLNGEPVLLDPNDLKITLESTIRSILYSSKERQRIRETFSSPICKPGTFGWVKYKFSSDYDIQYSWGFEKTFIKLDLEILHFLFPSEAAFRKALHETE